MDEIQFYLLIVASSVLDLLGILTLITNEGQIAIDSELEFNVPVLLISPDVQGIGLLLIGSLVSLFALYSRR